MNLVITILNFGNASIQKELEKFFEKSGKIQKITAGALTHARKKLSSSAFTSLNKTLVDNLYDSNNSKCKEIIKRISGVDGTCIELPKNSTIIEEFDSVNNKGGAKPIGLASCLFDIVNKIAIDASLNPSNSGKNRLAFKHLEHVGFGDLLLFDRGYKCLWLMLAIVQTGADFLVRLPSNAYKEAVLFLKSDEIDKIVTLNPSKSAIKTCAELGIVVKPLKVRLLKIFLDSGETEILVTSLLDDIAFPYSIFKDLYHLRWDIEEYYKTIKCVLEVETFCDKSVEAVYHEFYASIFMSNLQAIITMESDVQKKIEAISLKRKLNYQENRSAALYYLKEKFVSFFTEISIGGILEFIKTKIIDNLSPIRPGRRFERKPSNYKLPKYVQNKKALA